MFFVLIVYLLLVVVLVERVVWCFIRKILLSVLLSIIRQITLMPYIIDRSK